MISDFLLALMMAKSQYVQQAGDVFLNCLLEMLLSFVQKMQHPNVYLLPISQYPILQSLAQYTVQFLFPNLQSMSINSYQLPITLQVIVDQTNNNQQFERLHLQYKFGMDRKKDSQRKDWSSRKEKELHRQHKGKASQEELSHINHLLNSLISKKQPAAAIILHPPREKYSESLYKPPSLQNKNAQLKMQLSKYKLKCQKLKIKKNDYKWLLQEVYSLILDIYKEFKIYLSHSKLLRMQEALRFMKKLLAQKQNVFNQNLCNKQKLPQNTFFNSCQETSFDEVLVSIKPPTDNVYLNQNTEILLKDISNWDEIQTNMNSERVEQPYKQVKKRKKRDKKISSEVKMQEGQKITSHLKSQLTQQIGRIVNRSIQKFYEEIKALEGSNQNFKQQIKKILKEVKQGNYRDQENYAQLITYKLNSVLNALSQHLKNKSQNNKIITKLKQMKDRLASQNNKKLNLHQTLLVQVDALQKIIEEQL